MMIQRARSLVLTGIFNSLIEDGFDDRIKIGTTLDGYSVRIFTDKWSQRLR